MNSNKLTSSILEDTCSFIISTKKAQLDIEEFKSNRDLFILDNRDYVNNFLKFTEIDTVFIKKFSCLSIQLLKKKLIKKFIRKKNPHWLKRIHWGIEAEVYNFLKYNDKNLYSVLSENGLISFSRDVIKWWFNEIAEYDKNKIETGIEGEYLSLRYETDILGINKKLINHISLKKSDVGYDIKSVVSKKNFCFKPIEVKSTKNYEDPEIYITPNEWKKTSIPNYIFHIWLMEEKYSHLYFLKGSDLVNSIPKNMGLGNWQSVKIKVKSLLKNKIISLDNKIDNF